MRTKLIAEKLNILACPTKLAVIDLLQQKPRMVGFFLKKLKIEATLLSYHLKILRDEGIVTSTRMGKMVQYSMKLKKKHIPIVRFDSKKNVAVIILSL